MCDCYGDTGYLHAAWADRSDGCYRSHRTHRCDRGSIDCNGSYGSHGSDWCGFYGDWSDWADRRDWGGLDRHGSDRTYRTYWSDRRSINGNWSDWAYGSNGSDRSNWCCRTKQHYGQYNNNFGRHDYPIAV